MSNTPKEETLDLDLNRLEEACQKQPRMMFHWGKDLALAKKKSKEAKNALKLCFAEASKSIRVAPGMYGLEKVTDASVEATVLTLEGYQKAQQNLVDTEYEEDVLDAFVKALTDRRGEIGSLVQLHGAMYWAKPDTIPEVHPRKKK